MFLPAFQRLAASQKEVLFPTVASDSSNALPAALAMDVPVAVEYWLSDAEEVAQETTAATLVRVGERCEKGDLP